jgi:hypothetical protein
MKTSWRLKRLITRLMSLLKTKEKLFVRNTERRKSREGKTESELIEVVTIADIVSLLNNVEGPRSPRAHCEPLIHRSAIRLIWIPTMVHS